MSSSTVVLHQQEISLMKRKSSGEKWRKDLNPRSPVYPWETGMRSLLCSPAWQAVPAIPAVTRSIFSAACFDQASEQGFSGLLNWGSEVKFHFCFIRNYTSVVFTYKIH